MDLQVFDLKNMRATFSTMLILAMVVLVIGVVLPMVFNFAPYREYATGTKGAALLMILVIITFIINRTSKNDLKQILVLPSLDEQIPLYEAFYKKRLWFNLFSLACTGVLYAFTNGRFLFFFFIFQGILFLLLYPNKNVISKELNNKEINFI